MRELRRSMDWVWEVAVTKTNLPRKWGWRTSCAGLNEDCGLELSGVAKPPDSSRTSGFSEVGGCGYFVLVGDEA